MPAVPTGRHFPAATVGQFFASIEFSTPGIFGQVRAAYICMQGNFSSSEHWSDIVNHNLAQSQIEGGVDLREVPEETVLEVRTRNHSYTIVNKGAGWAMICGHPEYCPEPVLAHIKGSTWGGAMLKEAYIGRGMRMEFRLDAQRPILTSPILEIAEREA